MFKFFSAFDLITRSMVHLRHEMVYSAYFPVLEVDKRSPSCFELWGYMLCRRQEGTNILAALALFLCR